MCEERCTRAKPRKRAPASGRGVSHQSSQRHEVEPVPVEVVDLAVGHQQHLRRLQLLDELGVVADEDDRALPLRQARRRRTGGSAGRGCWSARRAAAGCCARPSASPAPAWSSRRRDSVPASWNTFSPDSPNMPSSPRSWVSVRITPGGTAARMLSSSERSVAQVVVLLRVVADGDVVAEVERAEVGLGLAGEDAQQARLAGAVEPEHEQPLAAAEVERRRPRTRAGRRTPWRDRAAVSTVTPGDGGSGKRTCSCVSRGPTSPARPRAGRSASPCCAPSPPWWPWRRSGRRCPAGGRSPWPAASPCGRGAPRRPRGRSRTACRCPCTRRGGRRRPRRAVEVEHPGDRLVEQLEVVADHEQRAAVGAHEVEQPRLGVDVEVVRRLVEAAARRCPAKRMRASSTRRRSPPTSTPIGSSMRSARRPRPAAMRPRLALGGVAAGRGELAPRRCCSGPTLRSSGLFLHRDAQLLDADQLARRCRARTSTWVTAVRPSSDAGDARDPGAGSRSRPCARSDRRRLGLAAEHLEQAGLAGAVAADEADLVAGHDGERRVVDDEPTTHLHRESLHLQHGCLR